MSKFIIVGCHVANEKWV